MPEFVDCSVAQCKSKCPWPPYPVELPFGEADSMGKPDAGTKTENEESFGEEKELSSVLSNFVRRSSNH